MRPPVVFEWETYPEYRSLQQLGTLIGGVLAALPRRQSRRAEAVLVPAAYAMARAIVGAHAEVPRPAEVTRCEREAFRRSGLHAVAVARSALRRLAAKPHGARPGIIAALEVLERIEAGMRERPLPGGPG